MIGKLSRCHKIPQSAPISFLLSLFPLCCSPNIVGWKIDVRNVRYLLDIYVEGLYVEEIWLRGSAYWLRYQQQCLDQ